MATPTGVGLVDETGRLLFGDELLVLFARDVLPPATAAVVFDVKCSQALLHECSAWAARPKCGAPATHTYGAHAPDRRPLARDERPHVLRRSLLRLRRRHLCRLPRLEIVAADGVSLGARLADLPRFVSTPEIRVDSSDADKFRIVDTVAAHFRSRYPTIDVDGVRILFPLGWALVRASNTQPILVLRFEATTDAALAEIRGAVQRELSALGVGAIP